MANVNKIKRTAAKSSLTRFTNHFNSIKDQENVDCLDLRRRLEKIEDVLEQFQQAQFAIETEDPDCENNYELVHSPERERFENDFFSITSLVKQFLDIHDGETNRVENVSSRSSSVADLNVLSNIRLPQLNLPTFDGSLDQWLFFRDSFGSIIHQNTSMSNVQKFHYLRLSLRGTAADRIKSLQICDVNYEIAWKLLHERYENKQILMKNHIKAIFELPILSKETHTGLNQILDGLEKNLNALKVLNRPTEHWDDLIIYIISSKFDNTTRRAWESRADSQTIPTLETLKLFLEERCRILSSLDSNINDNKYSKHPSNKNSKSFISTQNNQFQCVICDSNNHNVYTCNNFSRLTPTERLNTAKRLRLCINCLKNNHRTNDCKSSGCRRCGKIHHSLLHFQKPPAREDTAHDIPSISEVSSSEASTSSKNLHVRVTASQAVLPQQILLSTAVITVFDKLKNPHHCRVLLDSGSQINFISEKLANILQLPKKHIDMSISGFNQIQKKAHFSVSILFKSNVNNFDKSISCIVLPQITDYLPNLPFNSEKLNIPKKIILADPNFDKPAPIDLLIGADTFWDLLSIGQIKLGNGLPILQKSKLGWIISGPIHNQSQTYFSHHCCTSTTDLESQLARFWELEDYPRTRFLSSEEASCEEHFKNTLSRHSCGRFIVHIPFKRSPSLLGESMDFAKKRFLNLERKLEKNPNLKLPYHEFIKEYIDLGHMSLAEDQEDRSGFFLPHHCVQKEDSITTKLRVVFDGSSKTSSGLSLNDLMMIGPNIQDNLFPILLRFRKHNYVLSADIAKMYRQVLVQESDRNYQKILWRFSPNNPLQIFLLNTVTYGTSSAAYLAIRCLHEIALRHKQESPLISSIILHDFYVDDLLTGANTIDELNYIKNEISNLLLVYGFPLRKWRSNIENFSYSNEETLRIGDGDTKTLGLRWNPNGDFLQYHIQNSTYASRVTKRQILSSTAQIFDPLGLLSPVTITAKIILQELWKLNISWDESVPSDLYTIWSKYRSQLHLLNSLQIPRHTLSLNTVSVQLHGFCDASQTSYGACVYLRCCDDLNHFTSNLYCAKTRVAPLKTITIPRLELSGALLLAELVHKILTSCDIKFESVTYWSDSMICTSWINSSPHILKTFVANRVSQIQNLSNPKSWKHVSTYDNPADLLSRGISPSDLITSEFWFHGPSWLSKPESCWPSYERTNKVISLTDLPEVRTKPCSFVGTINTSEDRIYSCIKNYSLLIKLQRVMAYVLRYVHNLKAKESRKLGPLTTEELENSLFLLIRVTQRHAFSDDYYRLLHSKVLNKKSRLLNLNPFFDQTREVIRVGGRIQNSTFEFAKKHPVILPSNDILSCLIARHEHIRLMHIGSQALLASLRERFWPLSGRNLAKRTVHECMRCFRFRAKPQGYIMGNLPAKRIAPSRPFLITGIDYAGPILLRDRKGRNFKITKAYIALFVCFSSKAIHLEIVSDLTCECFLACLRRFMARRGKCSEIFSDNATTFVGANNEIKVFLNKHTNHISDDLSKEGVQWNFITPHAPHFGGIWESGVKSTKHHLKRVIGNASLTFEELNTVMCQIEACLNSRPLYPVSDDPNDLTPLTPAHFLIGESLMSIPEPNLVNVNERLLSRFQRLQQITQHFWNRWTKEYISSLQIRTKWKEHHEQLLNIGSLVLIKENYLPPLKWRLGRVMQIHKGSDHIIRSVTLKTSSGEMKRPVVKICTLPLHTDSTH